MVSKPLVLLLFLILALPWKSFALENEILGNFSHKMRATPFKQAQHKEFQRSEIELREYKSPQLVRKMSNSYAGIPHPYDDYEVPRCQYNPSNECYEIPSPMVPPPSMRPPSAPPLPLPRNSSAPAAIFDYQAFRAQQLQTHKEGVVTDNTTAKEPEAKLSPAPPESMLKKHAKTMAKVGGTALLLGGAVSGTYFGLKADLKETSQGASASVAPSQSLPPCAILGRTTPKQPFFDNVSYETFFPPQPEDFFTQGVLKREYRPAFLKQHIGEQLDIGVARIDPLSQDILEKIGVVLMIRQRSLKFMNTLKEKMMREDTTELTSLLDPELSAGSFQEYLSQNNCGQNTPSATGSNDLYKAIQKCFYKNDKSWVNAYVQENISGRQEQFLRLRREVRRDNSGDFITAFMLLSTLCPPEPASQKPFDLEKFKTEQKGARQDEAQARRAFQKSQPNPNSRK